MKATDVYPAIEEAELSFPQAAFVKELGSGSRWDNHFVDGVIEHHHVLPCERFKADVSRIVFDILGDIGVISCSRFDLMFIWLKEFRKPTRSSRHILHRICFLCM